MIIPAYLPYYVVTGAIGVIATILFATLLSLMIFGEIPGPRSLFGAALIVGAGLFIFLGGRKI